MGRVTTAEHYSDLQAFYERLNADSSIHLPLWFAGTRSLGEANRKAQVLMASLLDLRPGQRILDAGCGLGATSIWLAREFGVRVVGISNSASNIKACRRAAEVLGTSSLATFQTADLTEEFADPESYDAIWSLESLNYLHPKCRFIERVWKALKPGGIWVCMDRYLDTSRLVPDDHDLQAVTQGFYADDRWEPADELQRCMSRAGFEDIAYEDMTAQVLAAPRRHRVNLASAGSAIAAALRDPQAFRAMLRAFRILRASYRLMDRGVMSYGLLRGRRPGYPAR